MSAKKVAKSKAARAAQKRTYLKQSDVPSASLTEAVRVPQAILDHYAGKSATPLQVAKALNVDPKGSQIKVLSGAAMAFGLIDGGAQAQSMSLTDLGRRMLRPKEEGEDLLAKREAVLRPRVFGDFLRHYDGSQFPRHDLAINVIEEMGVPREKAEEVIARIEASAQSVGFIEEIKNKKYVTLQGTTLQTETTGDAEDCAESPSGDVQEPIVNSPEHLTPVANAGDVTLAIAVADDMRRRRVFITHGKNRDLVDPIKKLLEYGELEAVVSVERQSVSKPVPEKVMDDMRRAGAAIIHVEIERVIVDQNGEEHVLLNPTC